MRIERHSDSEMSDPVRAEVARYRYRVFVEQLGWDLPCRLHHEQDEFDIASATHLVARDPGRQVAGYARLLPTTAPYLLSTHFADLLGDGLAPASADVWELSRFAAADDGSRDAEARVGKSLLLEAVRFVLDRGSAQIVFCTTVGIERLARRWGVEICRLGPPRRFKGDLLVAAAITCSAKTMAALDPSRFCSPRQHVHAMEAGLIASETRV